MSFTTGLTLLFIGLKMTGFVDWSWWWVLSPILGWFIMMVILAVIKGVLDFHRKKEVNDALNMINIFATRELEKQNNQ